MLLVKVKVSDFRFGHERVGSRKAELPAQLLNALEITQLRAYLHLTVHYRLQILFYITFNSDSSLTMATSTRGASSKTPSAKPAAMAGTVSAPRDKPSETVSMTQLVAELGKQRASLKEDIATLIKEAIVPLQVSVTALTETVSDVQTRLTNTEMLAGDNFEALNVAEKKIQHLQEQNAMLLDRLEDLENRSRRANLRILNVPEDSEKGQSPVKFVSDMLMEAMPDVFDTPPELERAHRSLADKPSEEDPPRPFIVCFHKFQEKENTLHFARAHDVQFRGISLRIYPDWTRALAKRRAEFKDVKRLLYQKKVWFRLRYPAKLRVKFGGKTYNFSSPQEAQQFYDRQIAMHQPALEGQEQGDQLMEEG